MPTGLRDLTKEAGQFPPGETFTGPVHRVGGFAVVIEVEYKEGQYRAYGVDKHNHLFTQGWGGATPQEAVGRLLAEPRGWI